MIKRYIRQIGNPSVVLAVGYFDNTAIIPPGFELIDGDPAPGFKFLPEVPDPVDLLTIAVKSLPVVKRTNPTWGMFLSQCLVALSPPDGIPDMEAVKYLIGNFQTSDPDYLNIINQAKQLFGMS